MKTTTCPDCGKEISNNNFKKHLGSKTCLYNQENKNKKQTAIQEDWLLPNGKYKCPHCDKQYTKNGICTHIWRTHGDGQNFTANNDTLYKNGKTNVRKGLTKENDEKTLIASLKFKEKCKNGEIKLFGCSSEEHRKSISKGMKKAYKKGLAIGWSRRKILENDERKANSKSFLYLGLFEIDDIKFLKIGTAKNGFKNRYNSKIYDKFTKTLKIEVESTALKVLNMEQKILRELNKFKFQFPEMLGKFDGYSECFKIEALNDLMDYITSE